MSRPAIVFLLSMIVFGFLSAHAGGKSKTDSTNKIRIALVFDLSGRREPAVDVVNGIEFAVSELRSKGKIVEIIKFNSESDALGTRNAMMQALSVPADIIIAEIDSSKAMIAAEMAENSGRVMVTPYATSPVLTAGRKFVFRSCFSDDFQGEKLAKFAREFLKATTAVLYADGGQLYSKSLAEAFRKKFTEMGGRILADSKIIASAISFKDQLDEIEYIKPDVVFLPLYEQTAARLINEAVLRGALSSYFLGGDGWGASRTFQDIIYRKGSAVKAYWVSHYSGDFSNSLIADADQRYQAMKNVPFNASSAIGYDALNVAVRAIELAGNDRSQEKIAQAIHALPVIQGLSGSVYYGKSQDPKKSLFIRKIDKDKMGFVTELKP